MSMVSVVEQTILILIAIISLKYMLFTFPVHNLKFS